MDNKKEIRFINFRIGKEIPTKTKIKCSTQLNIEIEPFKWFEHLINIKVKWKEFLCLSRREILLEDIVLEEKIDKSGLVVLAWLSHSSNLYFKNKDKLVRSDPYLEILDDGTHYLIIKDDRDPRMFLKYNADNKFISKKLKILSKKRIVRLEPPSRLPDLDGYNVTSTICVDYTHDVYLHHVEVGRVGSDYGPIYVIEQNGILIALDVIIKVPYLLEGMFGIRHELLYTKMVELIGRRGRKYYGLTPWL